MKERHEFIDEMQRVLGELQVKASLAKLKMGDLKESAKGELLQEYDKLHDKLRDLKNENEDEWAAVKGGFLSSWDAFKARLHDATKDDDDKK